MKKTFFRIALAAVVIGTSFGSGVSQAQDMFQRRGQNDFKSAVITKSTVVAPPAPTNAIFFENFEDTLVFPPAGWRIVDADGDGHNWIVKTGGTTFNMIGSLGCALSASYAQQVPLTPNNYMITPAIHIPNTALQPIFSFMVAAQDPAFRAERFQVKITTDTAANAPLTAFTTLMDTVISWADFIDMYVPLQNYIDSTVRFAIVHNGSTDMFQIKIDNVKVDEQQKIDLGVIDLIVSDSLTLTNNEPVKVSMVNLGYSDAVLGTAKLLVNNVQVAEETISAISANGSLDYTFQQTADLSAMGVFEIKVILSHDEDLNAFNDTIIKEVRNYGTVIKMHNGTVTACDASFFDDGGTKIYDTVPSHQTLTVTPETQGSRVKISFIEFSITPDFSQFGISPDTLSIYHGSTPTEANLAARLIGPQGCNETNPLVIQSQDPSGALCFEFANNGNRFQADGWIGFFSCAAAPAEEVSAVSANIDITNPAQSQATFIVKNVGTSPIAALPVTIIVATEAGVQNTITGAFTTAIAPNQEGTFTTQIDLSAYNDYRVVFAAANPTETDRTNDTISKMVSVWPAAALTWDFEQDMPATFTIVNHDGNTVDAELVQQGIDPVLAWNILTATKNDAIFGYKVAVSASAFTPQAHADRWMILPQITLAGSNYLEYIVIPGGRGTPEQYKVMVSTTDKEKASFTNTLLDEPNLAAGMIKRLDLSAYNGQSIYIAFVNVSKGVAILMDNIKILGQANELTSLAEVKENNLSVYPNPVKDVLNIHCENIKDVTVFDVQGRALLNGKTNTINLSSLTTGVYVIKVTTNKGVSTLSVVKE